MKYITILLLSVGIVGCSTFAQYAVIVRGGVEFNHIKSLEDCERIIEKFKINGICVEE